MARLRHLIASLVDIRKGEALITLLMFSYYYIILVTYYLLKPARDSLFLVKLGAEQLPVVFIITAIIIAPITTVYAAASRSLKLTQLIYVTSGILVVNLVALRWLLTLEAGWVPYVFYVWVSIYGALTASQYWLFANAVYNPSQGKRLFAFLNLGGILGAMTGGEVTGFFVRTLGVRTEDLLFFCIAFVATFALFVAWVWRLHLQGSDETTSRKKMPARKEQSESIGQMFRLIKSSRHLMYLVGIIALTMATASFVDFQFKTISVQAYPEKENLTAFLGVFYGRLSMVSLLLQVVFAYRIVRLVGVAGVVMFLPLGLLLGSGFMLVMPGLLAAILLRGADGALKYSLDKTGRELLFLPIPLEVKKRTKVFIDMFVDRWFRGVAGAALLLCTTVLGFSVQQLSLVVLVLLAGWLTLVLLIRKEYVNAFRLALARRELDPAQLMVNIQDASTLDMLRDLLKSDSEREVVYALDMLSGVEDTSLAGEIRGLLKHPSRDVKKRALALLHGMGVEPDLVEVEPLVRDADPDVRVAAIVFTVQRGGEGAQRLRRYVEDDDARVAASALRCAADAGGAAGLVTIEKIERLMTTDGEHSDEVRIEVVRALGSLADPSYRDVLRRLARDDSSDVAGEAILAMGATHDRDFVPDLLGMVADAARRRSTRSALVEYGNGVVGTIGDYLGDETIDMGIRRNLPVVLSRIPTQQSADALAANLTNVDASLRFRIVKALNKLRKQYPDLTIAEDRVDAAFIDETKTYYEILHVASQHRGGGATPADALLARALEERMDHNLERIFRLLGLHYAPDDIYNAYLGIVSSRKDQQASAVEFLDNVLGTKLKTYLFPIIDQISESVTIQRGRDLFGIDITSREQGLLSLMRGRDAWLRACAVYCSAGAETEELREAVKEAGRDADPVVAETAKLVLDAV